jgi:hypothetical protein
MSLRSALSAAVSIALIALTAQTGVSSESPAVGDFVKLISDWGGELELDERVIGQIDRYSREEDDLGDTYPKALAAALRRLVLRDAAQALKKVPFVGGDPSVEVTFLESGFAGDNGETPNEKHRREFEEGFVRIDVLATFAVEGVTPEEALRAYTGKEFRMKTSSRIKRIWSDDDLSCVEVKGVKGLLSPTLACNRIDELIRPELATQHSQAVSNPGDDDYHTVYFKESLKTFVEVPGGLALHYINYTRAVKLGSVRRTFGGGIIEDSEEAKIRELQRRLSNESE